MDTTNTTRINNKKEKNPPFVRGEKNVQNMIDMFVSQIAVHGAVELQDLIISAVDKLTELDEPMYVASFLEQMAVHIENNDKLLNKLETTD